VDVSADTSWGVPPASPEARAGAVDVWRADLIDAAAGLSELLCDEERERAGRIVGERSRELWTRSRGFLRAVLGWYLEGDPVDLRFELGPHGKPALGARAGQTQDVRFNLSHSGELVLVAVSPDREVGVDVECTRDAGGRQVDEIAIAARALGPIQARRLRELEPDEREYEFLRMWTAHEATLKCLGVGLAYGPSSGEGSPDRALWTETLELGPRAAAAVAAQGSGECELRCWEWLAAG
jgi:4'-phosphopantetheinyl transferase